MTKIIILTAEPKNFVPVELLKAAQAKSIESEIVDITKVIVEESDSGKLYVLTKDGDEYTGMEELKVDSDTVIIPRLNEHHLDIKLGILKKLTNAGASLVNTAESMALCNDKLMSQVVLNHAGFRTPKSWVIQDADSFDATIKAMEDKKLLSFPIVLKTLRGTHGIGVMKLDSRSSLVSVGQTLLKEGIDFMLQEFLKHEKSCRIIMKGSELLAANLRGQPKEKDEFRTNSHLGSETEAYHPHGAELSMANQIVEVFGCKFCAIDYVLIDSVKEGYSKGDVLPEGVAEGHVHWQTNVVREGVSHPDRLLVHTKIENHWRHLESLTEDAQPEGFDKEIVVFEVNGSPGLEAMQKNWTDRNLAAEVIDFALSTVQKNDVVPEKPEESTPTPVADQLELIEPTIIHRVLETPTDAKVDTGATTSCLHVDAYSIEGQLVKFSRGEQTFRVPLQYMRHVKNNAGGDSVERPVVHLDVTVKGRRHNRVAFSLNKRDHMKCEILIGRNLIELLGLPVVITPTEAAPAEASAVEEE